MPDAYLVDSSSFLKVYEDYSGVARQNILNGLDISIGSGRIRTLRVVLDEVTRNNGNMGRWLQDRKELLLLPNDDQLTHAALVITRRFPDIYDEKRNYLQADPFVIGAAQLNGLIMVTDELPRHRRRERSRHERHIPDICDELNVPWISLFELLQAEGII